MREGEKKLHRVFSWEEGCMQLHSQVEGGEKGGNLALFFCSLFPLFCKRKCTLAEDFPHLIDYLYVFFFLVPKKKRQTGSHTVSHPPCLHSSLQTAALFFFLFFCLLSTVTYDGVTVVNCQYFGSHTTETALFLPFILLINCRNSCLPPCAKAPFSRNPRCTHISVFF